VRAQLFGVEPVLGPAFGRTRGIGAINKRLDESLAQFASRRLTEPFPYLILDARYEKVREAGVIAGQAVLIAIGIDGDGPAGCSESNWPTARAGRAGGIFSWACASAGSAASSSSLPTCSPA
jgi:Transposase, Mutator family